MVLEKIEVQATFEDEITSRVQNALDTMVEFGATTEQVSQAFNQLNKAQKAGAKGMAQQANVMRTLVDESENADFALRSMAKAQELAAQAGVKMMAPLMIMVIALLLIIFGPFIVNGIGM